MKKIKYIVFVDDMFSDKKINKLAEGLGGEYLILSIESFHLESKTGSFIEFLKVPDNKSKIKKGKK